MMPRTQPRPETGTETKPAARRDGPLAFSKPHSQAGHGAYRGMAREVIISRG